MKQERVLELFFRGLRGEDISVKELSNEYGVSTKSISRDINDLKAFLADHRDLVLHRLRALLFPLRAGS